MFQRVVSLGTGTKLPLSGGGRLAGWTDGVLPDQFADRLAVVDGAAEGVGEGYRAGVDPQVVVDRRQDVLRADFAVGDVFAARCLRAGHLAHLYSAAAEEDADGVTPVDAAVDRIHSLRAAELAHRHDERLVIQPAVDQVGQRLLERRDQQLGTL